jgi:2-(1,2-epoxy-1,2-dihydrophenyl)acetyl-CoA isomerase
VGYETIEVRRGEGPTEGVVTVTMNRPEKLNAMTDLMFRELRDAFSEVSDTETDRAVVLTGAGRAFCSGADLSGGAAGKDHMLLSMRRVGDAILAVHRCPKPTIAKVNGVATGAGFSIALACDLVVAADTARFSVIFARRGLTIDAGASWLLPRVVGLHRAKELALLADIFDAAEADRIGIVNRVVAPGELDAVVDDLSARLAAGPPLALRMTKQLLNHSLMVSMDQALDDESWCQAVNIKSSDTSEAMRAFLEKRPPRFEGR